MQRWSLRVPLLLGILACLFVIAQVVWKRTREHIAAEHARRADEARAERLTPEERLPSENGWSTLIIGRPSGAPAIASGPALGAAPGAAPASPVEAAPSPVPATDFEISVRQGQTLTAIVAQHYGEANAELIAAIARYNGIAADSLREGQKLRLPDLARLRAPR